MSSKIADGKFVLKAYSPKEIRALYGISDLVYKSWTKPFKSEIGDLVGKYYTVKQVQIIIGHLGVPGIVEL